MPTPPIIYVMQATKIALYISARIPHNDSRDRTKHTRRKNTMALPGVTDETIAAAQAGDPDAMWDVVSAHENILWGIINQVAPGLPANRADDLLQEGRAELITCIRQYDSTASAAQLHTYAYPRLRRAVLEAHIRETTKFSVDMTTVIKVRKALADYEGNAEMAFLSVNARDRISREVFMAVVDALRSTEPLDGRPGGVDSDLTYADTIADPAASGFTEPAERRALAHHLLTVVTPRQAYALAAHHGVGMPPSTDQEVADHLMMRPVGVRQLRSAGVTRARTYADTHGITTQVIAA